MSMPRQGIGCPQAYILDQKLPSDGHVKLTVPRRSFQRTKFENECGIPFRTNSSSVFTNKSIVPYILVVGHEMTANVDVEEDV